MSSSESVRLASKTKASGVEVTVDAEVVLETRVDAEVLLETRVDAEVVLERRVDAEVGWRVPVITDKPPLEVTTAGVEVVNTVGMVEVLVAVSCPFETASTLILDCCSKNVHI